jgi:hypothetical protein
LVIQKTVSAKPNHIEAYAWITETIGTDCIAWETPQITLDSDGRPHVAYHTYASLPSDSIAKYAFRDDSGWHTETITSGAKLHGITVNGYGEVFVSLGSNSKIYYAFRGNTGWETQHLDKGWESSLLMDSNGIPHISYLFEGAFPPMRLKHAYPNTQGDWQSSLIPDVLDIESAHFSLDSVDYPHFLYDPKMNDDWKHTFQDALGWHTESIPLYGPFEVDGSGHLHISSMYSYDSSTLEYAYYNGYTWITQTVGQIGEKAAHVEPTIAVNNSGYPHIVYSLIITENQSLKYAYKNSGGWHIETIASGIYSAPYLYTDSELVLDNNDTPHIVFGTSNSLGCRELNYAYQIPLNNQIYLPTTIKP